MIEAWNMDDTLDSSKYIQGNHALDLIGHLHCDVFNQDKFLINWMEVRMRTHMLERFILPYEE